MSSSFWREACGNGLPDSSTKKRIVADLLSQWDGKARPYPKEWGDRLGESKFLLSEAIREKLAAAKEAGLGSSAALCSALAQKLERQPTQGIRLEDVFCAVKAEDAADSALDKPQSGLTAEQVAILRGKLLAMRKQALLTLRSRREQACALHEDGARGDEIDRSDWSAMLEAGHAELIRARQTLLETDMALKRMDAGEYGYCEETGEPIGWRRLLANPLARYSLEAQERLEKRRRLGIATVG